MARAKPCLEIMLINGADTSLALPVTRQRWFAAYTKPCHEKRVAEHLELRNIEQFLPLYNSTRRWNNGCKVVLQRPLFPGYVFIHISRSERARVLELSGVLSIVGPPREPLALPDEEIERLRSGLSLVRAEPHPLVVVGERVRICHGPLEGLTGILTRKKSGLRVVLTVDLIMKSVAVEVCVDDVEPVHQLHALCAAAGSAG